VAHDKAGSDLTNGRIHRPAAPDGRGVEFELQHRLRPPGLPREVLRRPRLDAFFERSLARYPVLAVSAAPGSGKTVQAQLYAASTGLPTCWITLDSSHGSAGRLLADLTECLDGRLREPGQSAHRSVLRLDATAQEQAALVAGDITAIPALLVIDDGEHLDRSEEAQAVLETFLALCPATLHALLLSRSDRHGPLLPRMLDGRIELVDDAVLRLSRQETAELGELLGGNAQLVERVHEATGGWFAGAAFSLRYGLSTERVSNDLPSAIMHEVLNRLPDGEQSFLLDSSVPDVLTRAFAVELCGSGAHTVWDSVRAKHLPATTTTETTMRYHALFRTFLQRQLLARDPQRHVHLTGVYAQYLSRHGQPDHATECYLSIDDRDAACESALAAVGDLCARSDWVTILRWVEELGQDRLAANPLLLAAHVRALFGSRQFEKTVDYIRRLDRQGRLRAATDADHALLATAAWALQADPAEALRLLDRYDGDYRADVVRYTIGVYTGIDAVVPPAGSDWEDVERIMCSGLLLQGRLDELRAFIPRDPTVAVVDPNVILATVMLGDQAEARNLWNRVPLEIRERPQSMFIEALMLAGEGEPELAQSAMQVAVTDSRRSAFFLAPAYEAMSGYFLVRLGKIDEAIVVLQECVARDAAAGRTALVEFGQAALGFALLAHDRDGEAWGVLNEAVRSMVRAHRRLFLPLAAVCLAEAEFRRGNADAAHEMAEVAYRTAEAMGSFASIVPVTGTFPDLSTREDAHDPAGSMRWRRLVVSPSARPPKRAGGDGPTQLGLQPFGPDRDIYVNGEPRHVGRMKLVELLAYLVIHPDGTDRGRLQQALFPDATMRNGGNHFRQVSFKFRQVTGLSLDRRDGNLIGLPSDTVVDAADVRLEELLRTASWGPAEERVTLLRSALTLVPGPYLLGSNLAWAEERRNHLDIVQEEARLELVQLLLELGEPGQAREECETLLVLNPYSDPGYRLLVQIERTVGSESSVLAAYRRAVHALEELGLSPGYARKLMNAQPGSPRRPVQQSQPHRQPV
jgi:LuxR family transcriptional regulator, maltose regulon positive regulatory protein